MFYVVCFISRKSLEINVFVKRGFREDYWMMYCVITRRLTLKASLKEHWIPSRQILVGFRIITFLTVQIDKFRAVGMYGFWKSFLETSQIKNNVLLLIIYLVASFRKNGEWWSMNQEQANRSACHENYFLLYGILHRNLFLYSIKILRIFFNFILRIFYSTDWW